MPQRWLILIRGAVLLGLASTAAFAAGGPFGRAWDRSLTLRGSPRVQHRR